MMSSGYVLAERYRLGDRIATGGMGEVWNAVDTVLNRPVAVKVLRADLQHDANFGARFRAEAVTLATLHHPGVVDVYDYGEVPQADGTELAYLVMAFIHGEPLSARIGEAGHLGAAETMTLVAQVAGALQAAHDAGVIHRDIKPDNILIDAGGRAVIVDFGIARTSGTTGLTGVEQVVGTAFYMAPEQISGAGITPAVDVYALGVVAYHCLTGRPPFVGETAIAVAMGHLCDEAPPMPEAVPAPVRDIVAIAMSKDPAHRYPTAAAMAAAASAWATEPLFVAGVARPIAPTTTVWDMPVLHAGRDRRRKAPVLIGVAVALLALGVVLTLTLLHPGNAATPQRAGTSAATTPPKHAGTSSAPGRHRSGSTTPSPVSTGGPSPTPAPSTIGSTAPATAPATVPPTIGSGGGDGSTTPTDPGDTSPTSTASAE